MPYSLNLRMRNAKSNKNMIQVNTLLGAPESQLVDVFSLDQPVYHVLNLLSLQTKINSHKNFLLVEYFSQECSFSFGIKMNPNICINLAVNRTTLSVPTSDRTCRLYTPGEVVSPLSDFMR